MDSCYEQMLVIKHGEVDGNKNDAASCGSMIFSHIISLMYEKGFL